VVYRASHAMLRRPTAIKLLADGGKRASSRRSVLAGLNHPNIVTVHDYGHTADGSFDYAMELLDGMDLEKLVTADGPQPAEQVIHIVRQVVGGLHEAHDLGLVHRDIKPATVFLCRRWAGPTRSRSRLRAGQEQGEPAHVGNGSRHGARHAALHLSRGAEERRPRRHAQPHLSLGAVAYYVLIGSPFTGGSAVQVCSQHVCAPSVIPSERLGGAVPGPRGLPSTCSAEAGYGAKVSPIVKLPVTVGMPPVTPKADPFVPV
jgi:eukaryotic-like serine/threonine-protein kinase